MKPAGCPSCYNVLKGKPTLLEKLTLHFTAKIFWLVSLSSFPPKNYLTYSVFSNQDLRPLQESETKVTLDVNTTRKSPSPLQRKSPL